MNLAIFKKKLQELVSNSVAIPMQISETSIDSSNTYQIRGIVIVWDDHNGNILRAQLNDKGIRDLRFYSRDIDRFPHYHDVRFNEQSDMPAQLPWPESIIDIDFNELDSSWSTNLKASFDRVIESIKSAIIDKEGWIILE